MVFSRIVKKYFTWCHAYLCVFIGHKLKNLTDAVRYIWVWVCLTYKVRPLVNQILKVYHELWEIKPKWQNRHIAGTGWDPPIPPWAFRPALISSWPRFTDMTTPQCCRFVGCASVNSTTKDLTRLRSSDCGGHSNTLNSLSCSRKKFEIWFVQLFKFGENVRTVT